MTNHCTSLHRLLSGRNRAFNRRRGIALVLALLVLTVLTILAVQLSFTTNVEVQISQNYLEGLQCYYALKAGLNYSKVLLKLDATADAKRGSVYDALTETWAQQPEAVEVGGASVVIRLEDEERRFNLLRLVDGQGNPVHAAKAAFQRLLDALEIKDDTVVDRIVDYMDANQDGSYEADAKNSRMYTTEELFRIPGLTLELLVGSEEQLGFLPYVTVWGGNQININTASKIVLMSLSDQITADLADNIIEYRQSTDENNEPRNFKTIAELLQVENFPPELLPQIASSVTVSSRTFSAAIIANCGGISTGARAVLERSPGDAPVKTIFFDPDIVIPPTSSSEQTKQ
jgi:general secretion pathway protein K